MSDNNNIIGSDRNVVFGLTVYNLNSSDGESDRELIIFKFLKRFDSSKTSVRSFIRDTLARGRPEYIYDDDNIASVTSDCDTQLVDTLDATFADLHEFFVDAPKKILTVEIADGYVTPAAATHAKVSSSSSSDEPTREKKKKKKKKQQQQGSKKRQQRDTGDVAEKPRSDEGKKKRSKKSTRDEATTAPTGTAGSADDAAATNTADQGQNDGAIAAAMSGEYHEYVEGGRSFEANVIDYCMVSTGPNEEDFIDKFLVEWRGKAVTADAAAVAAQAASSSSSSNSTQQQSPNSEPLCISWTRLDELIVPSAALAFLDSSNHHIAEWEVPKIRARVVAFANALKADCLMLKAHDESEACGEIDFCCYVCKCGRKETSRSVTKCEIISKYHRNCCHRVDDTTQDSFRTSLGFAQERHIKQQERFFEEQEKSECKPAAITAGRAKRSDSSSSSSDSSSSSSDSDTEVYNKVAADEVALKDAVRKHEREKQRFLNSRTRSARSRESRTDNDLALAAQDSMRLCDPVAVNVHKEFYRICKERETDPGLKRQAVVLSLFSGIGCAEIALKKLGIDIARVIVVEHDRVCQHVYRQNHDHKYGGGAPDDGIEYVFLYETFEECIHSLKALVKQYGLINVIIGGPPCQEFSKVNAFRRGVDAKNGEYMRLFATLIKRVRKYNKRYHGGSDDLFFLVENVPGAEKATEKANRDMYGVSEYRCDAALFGPCHRDRIFYFNWLPDKIPEDESPAGGTSCFNDGWMMPTMFKKSIDAKVMTLLASKGRTKDVTLHKWKIKPGMENSVEPGQDRPAEHGDHQLININDREKLMGIPVQYVDKPVEDLFIHLRRAFTVGMEHNTQWRDVVPPKYWNFLCLGPERYSFGIDDTYDVMDHKRIALSLKDWNQRTKVTLKDFEYGWHVIGNGFSIPQVMYLLRPLQKLFKTREYPGYTDQRFAWEDGADAIGNDDGNIQGEANDADAAAAAAPAPAPEAAGNDDTANANRESSAGSTLVAVTEQPEELEKPSAAMEAETTDADSSDDDRSM